MIIKTPVFETNGCLRLRSRLLILLRHYVLHKGRQQAALFEIGQFTGGVDAQAHVKFFHAAFAIEGAHQQSFADAEVLQTDDLVTLAASEVQALDILAGLELQGQHTHAHQVGAVDALEGFGQHSFDAQKQRPLGGPIAAGAGAIFLAGQQQERHAFGLVLHGHIVQAALFAIRQVKGKTAFHARQHLVLDANVSQGTARQHLIVAAARAVGVELAGGHTQAQQVLAGGTGSGDISSG